MKKTIAIMSVIVILVFAVSAASGNTLFTKDETEILQNWNKNKAVESVGEPEAYSEPESAVKPGYRGYNTLFIQDEWNVLQNWNKNKAADPVGEPEAYSEPESARK